jgi:hypothetical protein
MPTAYASISAYYAISKTRYILIEYDIDIILLININTLFENKSVVKKEITDNANKVQIKKILLINKT